MGLEMDVLLNRLYELRTALPVVNAVLVRPKNLAYAYGLPSVEFYQKAEGNENESVEALATRLFQTEKALFDIFRTVSNTTDWTLTLRGDWLVKSEKGGKLFFYRIVSLSDKDGVVMLNSEESGTRPASRSKKKVVEVQTPTPDPLKLPSRFQPGDTVVYHVFGGDKWIGGCEVRAVTFTVGGKILYDLAVPVEFQGLKPVYCPVDKVVSEWVVSRVGEKNDTVTHQQVLQSLTANEG